MNTSYDQIWTFFLNNCKVSDIDLPQTDQGIYDAIHNAILYFNNRLRDELQWDDLTETVSRELSGDDLLILVNYLRLIFLINQRTYFESTWIPFQKDIGIKNFGTQLNSLRNSVEEQEKTIDKLIMNTEEDFL